MKVLDLRCQHGHRFEGWFASEDDFLDQNGRGLVECPLCGDRIVQRLPSAPRLNLSGATEPAAAPAPAPAIAPSGWNKYHENGKIDLLIGSPSAINFDGPHPSVREIWKLEEALASLESDYDLVIIDCAPSLNALTRTAWAASDRVLVVTEPGLFAVSAADRALRAIDEIKRGVSPRLQPLGILINRSRPQSMEHQFRTRELREMFGPLVLDPQLPERTSLQQAQGAAKPVHMWPGEAAQEMAGYFDEVLDQVIAAGGIKAATTSITRPTARNTIVTDRADDDTLTGG